MPLLPLPPCSQQGSSGGNGLGAHLCSLATSLSLLLVAGWLTMWQAPWQGWLCPIPELRSPVVLPGPWHVCVTARLAVPALAPPGPLLSHPPCPLLSRTHGSLVLPLSAPISPLPRDSAIPLLSPSPPFFLPRSGALWAPFAR